MDNTVIAQFLKGKFDLTCNRENIERILSLLESKGALWVGGTDPTDFNPFRLEHGVLDNIDTIVISNSECSLTWDCIHGEGNEIYDWDFSTNTSRFICNRKTMPRILQYLERNNYIWYDGERPTEYNPFIETELVYHNNVEIRITSENMLVWDTI